MDTLWELWPFVAGGLTVILSAITSAHAAIYKRDDRSAVGWFALCWFAPVVGPLSYVIFGINRIRRKAIVMRADTAHRMTGEYLATRDEQQIRDVLPHTHGHLDSLPRLVDKVARRNIVYGNHIDPLLDGEQAYPAMLDAINGATKSIALCTYIFDNDETGHAFAEALSGAVKRGVEVRVLIDAAGTRYSFPPITRRLRKMGIRTALFAPTWRPWQLPFMNLRNHRKVLVVDGTVGFTGGLNIRHGHRVASARRVGSAVRDTHFRITGPVVAHLMQTFVEDWVYATKEWLTGESWFPELSAIGEVAARGLTDGPDEDFEKLRWTILGALACAKDRIRVATPYFVPDMTLITSLTVAAMRGVDVEIMFPEYSNLRFVDWARNAHLSKLVNRDIKLFMSPKPFDHSKIMVVDDTWTLVGSANWDARSLRLNFEFNLECYSDSFAERVNAILDDKRSVSREVTWKEANSRKLPVRLRDGIARLASPYL